MAHDTKTNPHATGTAPQASSPFLKLPPELRNRIYEAVLTDPYAISAVHWDFEIPRSTTPEQPPLTRTCRAIRAEALPIFYSSNTFMIGVKRECDAAYLRVWLKAIGPQNRDAVHEVIVRETDWRGCVELIERFERPNNRFLKGVTHLGVMHMGKVEYTVIKLDGLTFDD